MCIESIDTVSLPNMYHDMAIYQYIVTSLMYTQTHSIVIQKQQYIDTLKLCIITPLCVTVCVYA